MALQISAVCCRIHPSIKHHYPLLSGMAAVALVLPVSNVWPERAASILKWQKNRLRTKLKNDLLTNLLRISLNGPDISSPTFRPFMQHVLQAWLAEKKRRKLSKESQSPNQPLTLGEHVSQVARETMTEPKSEPALYNYLIALNLPSKDTNSNEEEVL